jgi:hypothetical protein
MDILNNTPETDKAQMALMQGGNRYSFPEHARRMERERNSARQQCAVLRHELERLADALKACQRRMGCHSCDGDVFCEQCAIVYLDAEKKLYEWNAMREASNAASERP